MMEESKTEDQNERTVGSATQSAYVDDTSDKFTFKNGGSQDNLVDVLLKASNFYGLYHVQICFKDLGE